MPKPIQVPMPTTGLRLAAGILVIASLYWAREVLIPLALAVLLAFILTPIVVRLERAHVPTVPAVVVTTLLAVASLSLVGWVLGKQVISLADSLPQYEENIRARVRDVKGGGSGVLDRAADVVGDIREEIEAADEDAAEEETEAAIDERSPIPRFGERLDESLERIVGELRDDPLPVEIHEAPPSQWQVARTMARSMLAPLLTAGIVVVFVIFFLIQRRDLRDRLIRIGGEGRLDLTTQAINEAGRRISRYLLAHLTVNATYGVPVMIGLWLLDLPGAVFWGSLTIVLRFIPYLGPWLGAGLPILLSLAVFEGWTGPLSVIGLFVGLELLSNNFMEPWLYGSSTGMSPVAVLLAAIFWAWLWGPIGLLLAVPLTVILVVLGKYVPQLELFTILLGSQPALSAPESFYQRVLALDDDEASDMARSLREEKGLLALYDDVLLPALHLEERARHGGRLDEERMQIVRDSMRAILEEVEDEDVESAKAAADVDDAAPKPPAADKAVFCLPARDEGDELAAGMLAHLLRAEGFGARAFSRSKLVGEMIEEMRAASPRLVFISALPPAAVPHSRYLCKRIEAALPSARVAVGLWNWRGDPARATRRLLRAGADQVLTTFAEALEQVRSSLG